MDDARRARLGAIPDRALADNVARYRAAGRQDGGPFTLAELLGERHDREKPGAFGTVETARIILTLASASLDGVTTYRAIWDAFRPGAPWRAFASLREVTNALERVQHHCLRRDLPLIATLVVNAGDRGLTAEAKANIVGWAREHGMAIGADPDAFIADHQAKARALSPSGLD